MTDVPKIDRPRVDERGILPPSVYAIEERAAPPRAVLLGLSGELDVAAAPELRERFEDALARDPAVLVVDMAEVTFADSSVLRELLRADAALRAAGSRLLPAALPPAVERLLELTRLRELLDIQPSVDEALRQLG